MIASDKLSNKPLFGFEGPDQIGVKISFKDVGVTVYWQAKEISRVLKIGIPEGEDINISLLKHVSPIEWENVIL
jgi:hypothetical protein